MEQSHGENKKTLRNIEIQEAKNKIEEHIQMVQKDFDNALEELSEEIRKLEEETKWKTEAHSDIVKEFEVDLESHIKYLQGNIRDIQERVASLTLFKSVFETHFDQLAELEKHFKEILLHIDPERVQ